jgi:hypothetical protein
MPTNIKVFLDGNFHLLGEAKFVDTDESNISHLLHGFEHVKYYSIGAYKQVFFTEMYELNHILVPNAFVDVSGVIHFSMKKYIPLSKKKLRNHTQNAEVDSYHALFDRHWYLIDE